MDPEKINPIPGAGHFRSNVGDPEKEDGYKEAEEEADFFVEMGEEILKEYPQSIIKPEKGLILINKVSGGKEYESYVSVDKNDAKTMTATFCFGKKKRKTKSYGTDTFGYAAMMGDVDDFFAEEEKTHIKDGTNTKDPNIHQSDIPGAAQEETYEQPLDDFDDYKF